MPELNSQVALLVEKLGLLPHPEGGWYREVYRSGEKTGGKALPPRFTGDHAFSTSIYYLLESGDFSAFHRIKSDETWHFYLGSPLKLYILQDDGSLLTVLLGDNVSTGHVFQWTIPYGLWFAAEVSVPGSFSLMGCTVSPGFEFDDMEMATLGELKSRYSRYATLIRRMTRI